MTGHHNISTKVCLVLAAGLFLVGMIGAARADVTILDHVGSNDPTGESPAWSLTTFGTSSGSGGDDGQPHWKIVGASGGYRYYDYNLTDAQLIDPQGWEITAILKAVHNIEPYNNDVMLQMDDGVSREWH